jgi:hypothetical protein
MLEFSLATIIFMLVAVVWIVIGLLGSAGRRAKRDEFYEINHEELKTPH